MNLKSEINKIHYCKNCRGIIFYLLKFCSLFYGIGSNFKNLLYEKKIIMPKKVNAKVISIGNLTTGGVGKTPVVAEIAKYYKQKSENVAIISRGYGGKLSNKNVNIISDGENIFYTATMAGDEPVMLAEITKCPVLTCKSRYNAAKYAIEHFKSSIILLDDGFQHRKLHRDLDILLVDSKKKFGNENLLPAGPLREPVSSIKRADKIIIINKSSDNAEGIIPNGIVCSIKPDYIYNIKTQEILKDESKIVAMSAIGQPQQFYDFLSNFEVVKTITFDDHHQYKISDFEKIDYKIVTTEKDAVKLKIFNKDNIYALKLRLDIDVEKILS